MKLAAVVVLYNPNDKIFENIKSYIDYVDTVYAVDNSSADHSHKLTDEKIVYLPNHENLGIAFALNRGAKQAIADGFEWLLTMDQDSSFSDDGVQRMKDFLTCCKQDENGKYSYEKIGLITPFHRMITNPHEKLEQIDSPAVVMTSGNIINLKAYAQIGGFKDWMFIDAVDFDYCLNLRDHGFDIWRLPEVELKHNLGDVVFKTFMGKTYFGSNHSPMRRYYIVRNRHYFCDMYEKKFPDYCYAERRCTKAEVKGILICEKQKLKKLFAMFKGYIDYKRGVKGEKS
ncbi:MAG: glycosyltransferase family 2 protein [Clostridia bacterium]|nr:glycosyltransferase family 2 protein [Clostridia bacterium]